MSNCSRGTVTYQGQDWKVEYEGTGSGQCRLSLLSDPTTKRYAVPCSACTPKNIMGASVLSNVHGAGKIVKPYKNGNVKVQFDSGITIRSMEPHKLSIL